jgi:hypothetical protein
MMPQDVATRWNSMYDMLDFTIDYQPAVDTMTARCDLDLRKYELSPEEWEIAEELRNVLKVWFCALFFSIANYFPKDFQRHDTLFLSWNPKSCDSDPGHGPHQQISFCQF